MKRTIAPVPLQTFRITQPRLHLPAMRGVIDRRMLVNFRCEPAALANYVPAPFRLKLVHGRGMAGICLIRLKDLRPRWLPSSLGLTSENAAHRIAVEWDEEGRVREGVYIPRRDTNSRLNHIAGSRLFPGVHHLAHFTTSESRTCHRIDMDSADSTVRIRVAARLAEEWPGGSIFPTVDDASAFFAAGSLGWSAGNRPGEMDGLELHSVGWRVEPLAIERVESSFFDNKNAFTPGTVEFDSALLMRGIQHEWHGRGRMTCPIHST